MKYAMLLLPAFLLGCAGAPAGPPAVEYLSDGSKAWSTSCTGRTPSGCYKKAHNQCSKGINQLKLTQGFSSLGGRGNTLYYKCK